VGIPGQSEDLLNFSILAWILRVIPRSRISPSKRFLMVDSSRSAEVQNALKKLYRYNLRLACVREPHSEVELSNHDLAQGKAPSRRKKGWPPGPRPLITRYRNPRNRRRKGGASREADLSNHQVAKKVRSAAQKNKKSRIRRSAETSGCRPFAGIFEPHLPRDRICNARLSQPLLCNPFPSRSHTLGRVSVRSLPHHGP